MPTYEYRAVDPKKSCPHCREPFEVHQSMRDEPLRVCPECGSPIERIVSLCSMSTAQSSRSMLSDSNLKKKGFTKLVNEGGGKFRKVT
jgi:putative FmdB family regulatory protein